MKEHEKWGVEECKVEMNILEMRRLHQIVINV